MSGFTANFDNFKFLYELIITHFRKFFNEKFSDLAANYLALLQKEKASFGVFVINEFRRGLSAERQELGEELGDGVHREAEGRRGDLFFITKNWFK